MTDVFISYAREDRHFVQRLHDALAKEGRESWVDWEGIPASAEWRVEVQAAIDQADCFCFVLSPDSVESPVCQEEAAHAAASNKRIVPLLHREVTDGLVPDVVAARNWISFSDQDFEAAFAILVKALETEPQHLHDHTRLLVRAKEWEASRDRSLLLRGSDLTRAENWLSTAHGKEPVPTQQHTVYVLASRKAASRRQRATVGTVVVALAISLALLAIAVNQRSAAQDAQARAEEQERIASAQALAAQAVELLDRDPELSLLLAMEAAKLDRGEGVEEALRQVLLSVHLERTFASSHQGVNVVDIAVSADGSKVAMIDVDGMTNVWDVTTGEALVVNEPLDSIGESASTSKEIAVSNDGRVVHPSVRTAPFDFHGAGPIAYVGWDGPRGKVELSESSDIQPSSLAADYPGRRLAGSGPDGIVYVWDARTGDVLARLANSTPATAIAFAPRNLLATGGADGVSRIWDLTTRQSVSTMVGHRDRVTEIVIAPDERHVVSGADDGTVRLWRLGPSVSVASRAVASGSGVLSAAGTNSGFIVQSSTGEHEAVYLTGDGTIHFGGLTARDERLGIATGARWRWRTGSSPPAFALSTNGEMVALADPLTLRIVVFSSTNGRLVAELPWTANENEDRPADPLHPTQDLFGLAFSVTGGELGVVHTDGSGRIFEIASGTEIASFELGSGDTYVVKPVFSPSGRRLAVAVAAAPGGEDAAVVFDAATGEEVSREVGHSDFVSDVAFLGEDKIVTASWDGTAAVWDVMSGERLVSLIGHTGPVRRVVTSRDYGFIVTSSIGFAGHHQTIPGDTRIWRADGQQVQIIPFSEVDNLSLHARRVSVSWPPEQRFFACEVCTDIDGLIALAQSRLTRELTDEERVAYLR